MHTVPPKPEGSTWTDEQWQAICLRGENVLVTAAAGSGKTAVLTERVVRRLADEADPVDVDRLLVVTFSNAAAAEMRDRIASRLEALLAANPTSRHLRRQLALLPRAAITTIHAFCLDVVERHADALGLPPVFRVADPMEALLLEDETLEAVLEEAYRRVDGDPFSRLADWMGSAHGDASLKALVKRVHAFARSHPWPEVWLEEAVRAYEEADVERVALWRREWARHARAELVGLRDALRYALTLTREPGGPAAYAEALQADLALLDRLVASAGSWEGLTAALEDVTFARLKSVRGEVDEARKARVKAIRDRVKKRIDALREVFRAHPPGADVDDLRNMAPVVRALVELVRAFSDRYSRAKRERGLVDFADLEHGALKVLCEPAEAPHRLVPSAAAQALRRRFVEVLVDEYQDTSRVQEAILRLVARDGSRFLVGDGKQSIYRFRQADPTLFVAKSRAYRPVSAGGSAPACEDGEGTVFPGAPARRDGDVEADARWVVGTCAADCEREAERGVRIDLARNFRSRQEVVDATNFLFRQLMDDEVAEVAYDARAELVCGASYPPADGSDFTCELVVIDRAEGERGMDGVGGAAENGSGGENGVGDGSATDGEADVADLESARLEARAIARTIRALMGQSGAPPLQVFDKEQGSLRPVAYRDIVVLLRESRTWAPLLVEEFRLQGIPACAELSTGYLDATEVQVVLSLLAVLDNPYQDIPLAAVLRSPIVGLTADDLAHIRLQKPDGSFYEAVKVCAALADPARPDLSARLRALLADLDRWRTLAVRKPLDALLDALYRETGYFEAVGAMPGGSQRQANLQALLAHARQFARAGHHGLYRFLRVVEALRAQGEDFGAARPLGEQEDVVRILTIHKSKGLEFPVVIVAGLGKRFNEQDEREAVVLHPHLGLGAAYVDLEAGVRRATLPQLVIRQQLKRERLAEELRLLYVACTRAREKLVLVGTVGNLAKAADKWARAAESSGWLLPAAERVAARSFLDWIAPAVLRHRDGAPLRRAAQVAPSVPPAVWSDVSRWAVRLVPASALRNEPSASAQADAEWVRAAAEGRPVPVSSPQRDAVVAALEWRYPYAEAEGQWAKLSVSALKRKGETEGDVAAEWEPGGEGAVGAERAELSGRRPFARVAQAFAQRPAFAAPAALSPAERGRAVHAVLQRLDLDGPLDEEAICAQLEALVRSEHLTPEQAEAVDVADLAAFFASPLGQRLRAARRVWREVSFTIAVPARACYGAEEKGDASPAEDVDAGDLVLVQGVIDCLFEEDGGLVLLDYKTDRTDALPDEAIMARHRAQLVWYAHAASRIWRRPVRERYLVLLDGCRAIRI